VKIKNSKQALAHDAATGKRNRLRAIREFADEWPKRFNLAKVGYFRSENIK